MILGAVLAGGKSSRFGSDKALALLGGHTLIAHAVDRLSDCCDSVVVIGRETAPAPTLPDWPAPYMGPLGGIAAALRYADQQGYQTVLTCSVDSADLPENLPNLLAPGPSYLSDQPVIGLWPVSAVKQIEEILEGSGRHSMKQFAEAIDARAVSAPVKCANINTPADLAELEKRHGL